MRATARWWVVGALISLGAAPRGCEPEAPVASLLRARPLLASVAAEAPRYRLQAVVGTVERGKDGRPRLMQQGFRLGAEYFYPASAVKLFAAVAALEELARLRRETGLPIDRNTPLVVHPLFADEVREDADPSNLEGGTITAGHEIRKLFLVSDNRAFNRLYELVGQDRLAASMARAGISSARIVHRLSVLRTAEENRRAPQIDFVGASFRYTLPERTSPELAPLPELAGLRAGTAYLSGDRRVEEAFDFTPKNRVALADLQRGLCMVVRPEVDCGGPGYELAVADRAFLLEAMSQLPRESANPRYDPAEYPDNYAKFLLPGLAQVVRREDLRIANKIGQAYGFMTENAYVTNAATGKAVFVAATLYLNEDGVLNDDQYEYKTVGEPFFAELGEVIAERFLTARGR